MAQGVLALVALLLAAATAGLAWCMAFPVRWDGVGRFGALALHFPLHLLVLTSVAWLLSRLAGRMRAVAASGLLIVTAMASLVMALAPTVAAWRYARELGVRVSLWEYVANSTHMNAGTPQRERTLVYGTAPDGTKLELDVWLTGKPHLGLPRPAILMIHGGAWNHGNRSMFPDWNRWLNELGYEVFDVEYRLPPPARWRDELGDVKVALAWVIENAGDYHVDPTRVTVMGQSAGANLALLLAYAANDSRLPPTTPIAPVAVRSVINVYGPSDMALLYRTSHSPDYVRPMMEAYIGGPPDSQEERYRLLSPLTWVSAKSPPTLTLLGTSDRLVPADQATLLDESLARAGVPHETVLIPANDHAFDVNWGGFGTQIAREKVRAFLEGGAP